MKRFTVKLVILIFAAFSLFALYLLVCFPILNTAVFGWEENWGVLKSETQISGNNKICTNSSSSGTTNNIFTFDFKNPVSPEISDYILLSITAKNTGLTKYPYGSIAVNLSEEKIDLLNGSAPGSGTDNVKDGGAEDMKDDEADNVKDDKAFSENNNAIGSNTGINIAGSPEIYRIQERTRIFVDGMQHNYYIPVGENKYWRHDWNLDGPILKGQISGLEIEIPKIDGVDIQINSVSLNKRPVFAADSHINYFFKSYFQLSFIDRYLTPAYVFLILFAVAFSLLYFLPKRIGGVNKVTVADDLKSADFKSLDLKERNSNVIAANANNIFADNLKSNIKKYNRSILKGGRLSGGGNGFKTLALLVPMLLLIFFSIYFINNYVFTVKGYWDSYKQYILSGRLDETYSGFSDFEKFVTWVGEKVPKGQNVIVLVKGEPIYIMAQTAYGLYPRDVKYMDISRLSAEEVADKISGLDLTYEYIVVLSEADKVSLESVKVKLEYSYRENAGFLYKLILK